MIYYGTKKINVNTQTGKIIVFIIFEDYKGKYNLLSGYMIFAFVKIDQSKAGDMHRIFMAMLPIRRHGL